MRILFMGTPVFAKASLQALVEAGHTVAAVYTQPDKKQNRGMKVLPSPVKEYAITQKIPVETPDRLTEAAEQMTALEPELIVVAAYGKLLPEAVLQIPKYGCINVHASLLPKYRGAGPIQWAILNGEAETGITIMDMVQELDAGDMLLQESISIGENETAEQLHDRLMDLGARLLLEAVDQIERGVLSRTPQDPAQATYAPRLTRDLSPLDFARPAAALHNQVRGLFPWPAATAVLKTKPLKILETRRTGEHTELPPGAIVGADADGIRVACGDGTVLRITRLQAQGKKPMAAADYLRGNTL